MFAENASITGLSKVWSSLSCSNYPGYHSCGWKMKCFINLTHSCLLRPTTVLYLGQAMAFPVQLKIPKWDCILLHLPVKRALRLRVLTSVQSYKLANRTISSFLLLFIGVSDSASCRQSSKMRGNLWKYRKPVGKNISYIVIYGVGNTYEEIILGE